MLKRDIQGKFALKDDDYRQVRSLRVTDETWKALGIAAECFGMTRADYLEQVIGDNASPSFTWTLETIHQAQITVAELANTPLSVATLETLRDQVLLQLKLGKQAPGYKAALKALNHFIAALTEF
jgi:hypothetical protein